MEITNDMVIFSHQYYDQRCFDRHERAKTTYNHKHRTNFLKDPRTGFDFDTQTAIRKLFIGRPSRANLVEFAKNRIPTIRAEQINDFFPMKMTN